MSNRKCGPSEAAPFCVRLANRSAHLCAQRDACARRRWMSNAAIPSAPAAPPAPSDALSPLANTPPLSVPLPSPLRAWLVVAILSLAGIVSYIDRQILNLLVEPIKADLGLSDVQVSLLQGFSFALLYAAMAIPLAWLADHSNRKWVILGGLVCWSGATFMSGFAGAFAFLFVARTVRRAHAGGCGRGNAQPGGLLNHL